MSSTTMTSPRPVDGVVPGQQTGAAGGIVLSDPGDPPPQVLAERGVPRSVLATGAVAAAVVDDGAKHVDLSTSYAGPFVDDQTSQGLAPRTRHDAGLAKVEAKALVPHDLLDGVEESRGTAPPAAAAENARSSA